MKRDIKIKLSMFTLLLGTLFSSCLKKDLPELPLFDSNEVTLVNVEYRYNGTGTMNGQPIVAYQKLTASQVIDATTSTITVTLTIPGTSGSFTSAERANIKLDHLWPYYNISTAATMKGINGTPNPGNITDCSKPLTYEVIAANGAKKTWTIKFNPLPLINQYEGSYTGTGYLYHPSSSRILNADKFLTTSGANGVLVDLGDLGGSGYQALLTVDANNNVTITAAPTAAGAPYTMFSAGLPATNQGILPNGLALHLAIIPITQQPKLFTCVMDIWGLGAIV
ncbi:DUF5018-related domain-containing protein [Pedobacter mendelii]|uniref:DUF5018-related domain-containing protein n=1 Tax=Pedobacter mendelii TaxID=1908240 RepID=UPI00361770AF